MPALKIFRPSLTDTIDPNYTAVPGQVVSVTQSLSRTDRRIATPDGELDLGTVCVDSLFGLPRHGVTFDKETGLTRESELILA